MPVHTEGVALSGQKICLDPGHGGSDAGAINEDYGLEEKDMNLDVSYGLKALLEADGAEVVEVVMTRTDDSDKSNNDRYTFCNNEQATILVSVHTNSSTDSSTDGSLALYFHKDDEVLAQAVYDVMYPYLKEKAPDPDSFTGFGLDRYASGVLLKSNMPAAMMEPLFMSNPAEAVSLTVTLNEMDRDGVVILNSSGEPTLNAECENLDCRRGQIAQAIHDGILNYVGPGGDSPPSVTITNPSDGDTVSGTVTVTADASDDDGVTQVEFFADGSSIGTDTDGSDGWSANWDTNTAKDGSHTVTATATDTAGQTASDSVDVTVDNVNDPPTASFTYACSGLTCDFDASGSSDSDGSIASYDWDFGDGNAGSGVAITHTYAATGTYTVTLTVTDDDGATDTDTQDVTVSEAAETVHVGDLDGASTNEGRTWTALVTITVHDADHNPVSDATVSGYWSGGASGTASCTTDGSGQCQVSQGGIHKRNSSVTFTVDDVTHGSVTYDSAANHDPDGDSDGTSITVSKP